MLYYVVSVFIQDQHLTDYCFKPGLQQCVWWQSYSGSVWRYSRIASKLSKRYKKIGKLIKVHNIRQSAKKCMPWLLKDERKSGEKWYWNQSKFLKSLFNDDNFLTNIRKVHKIWVWNRKNSNLKVMFNWKSIIKKQFPTNI